MAADQENPYQRVAIIGLGYVGLPLAMLFAEKGVHVLGFDIDAEKIKALQQHKSYISYLSSQEIRQLFASGRFEATHQVAKLEGHDAYILCVPTPLDDEQRPDLSDLRDAAQMIRPYVKNGAVVVLESSTFPGTTEEVLFPILRQGGRVLGRDFYLGYSPERIDPGNNDYRLEEIAKVVSGVTASCLRKIEALYSQAFQTIVPTRTPRIAEITKLLENIQRFINISLMNEMAIVCHELGIDIWEVIEAAKTKPYGFMPYKPSVGAGGHCIPVDPLYLQWKVKQYGRSVAFISLAEKINNQMPYYIISRLLSMFNLRRTHPLHVFLVGITYKKNVNDLRESKSFIVMEHLVRRGVNVSYHDPFVSEIKIGDRLYTSTPITPSTLQPCDGAVILTDHSGLPYDTIVKHAPLVFDTRNIIRGQHHHVIRL